MTEQQRLILVVIASFFLGFLVVRSIGLAGASTRDTDITISAPKEAVTPATKPSVEMTLEGRQALLLATLKDMNKGFEDKNKDQHVSFDIFWSTSKPGKAALVINHVPTGDKKGKVATVAMGTFFLFNDDTSTWELIPDLFIPQAAFKTP